MLKVDIDLKDKTKFRFAGEKAKEVTNIFTKDGLIYFGNVIVVPIDNLSNYYCREEE